MSFTISGIQAIPSTYSFASPEVASGGSIRPLNNKNTTDKSDDVNSTAHDTVSLSTPDKFKSLSSSSAAIPHAVSILPVKVPGVVEPLDTVTLTTLDKVRNLRQQGAGEAQIAASLNLPLKEVQSDLHIQAEEQHLSFTVAPVVSALQANPLAAVSAST